MIHAQERESVVNALPTTGNCINYLPAISLLRERRHTTEVLKTLFVFIKSKDFSGHPAQRGSFSMTSTLGNRDKSV
jgi:hypothetical protein